MAMEFLSVHYQFVADFAANEEQDDFGSIFQNRIMVVSTRRSALTSPHNPAITPSLSTVFQFRAVPRMPSVFSITVLVNFDSPIPSG